MRFFDRSCHFGSGLKERRFERRNVRFEFENFLHTGKVQTFVGEFLNATQMIDVGLAVTA